MPDSAATDRSGGLKARLGQLGPGLIVAAAFVGPGTVTTASIAGADYGFALLWALVFSVVAAMVLQEMSARLGVVSREGLGEALRSTFANPVIKIAAIVLVVAAIAVGNAAFQGGNLIGAGLGLETVFGGSVSPVVHHRRGAGRGAAVHGQLQGRRADTDLACGGDGHRVPGHRRDRDS